MMRAAIRWRAMPRRTGGWRALPQRQGGQAMIEYFVVLAFSVIILIKPLSATEPSVVEQLGQAIRDYHSNYSYAMAVAYVPNCTYAFSFDQVRPSDGMGALLTSGFNLSGTIDRCVDMLNPQLPMPDITSVSFSFEDFADNIKDKLVDMIEDQIEDALDQFLDPASLLSDFTGFDLSSFF